MLVLNLPFKALMFLTLMRPSLVLFLVLWLKLVKDFLKVRCRLALLPFLISCLIWLDLVASLPLIKERILVIILLLHFLSLMLDRKSGSAGMPRPISYAVFCLKKKRPGLALGVPPDQRRRCGAGIRGNFMSSSSTGNVGIVIVSHSSKIAEGAADMVRQMVGNVVPLAWTGGDVDGGLGTNVAGIIEAIETAW